jgi:hypothetical protein
MRILPAQRSCSEAQWTRLKIWGPGEGELNLRAMAATGVKDKT